jgi:hypothetical protein
MVLKLASKMAGSKCNLRPRFGTLRPRGFSGTSGILDFRTTFVILFDRYRLPPTANVQRLKDVVEYLVQPQRRAGPHRPVLTRGKTNNWLQVSLERKRDVKERCGLSVQERFESCEKRNQYAILAMVYQDCR